MPWQPLRRVQQEWPRRRVDHCVRLPTFRRRMVSGRWLRASQQEWLLQPEYLPLRLEWQQVPRLPLWRHGRQPKYPR
ncbi:MAG: hypothetical protein JWN70_744 [Planctomycetaceae bacterium]|nr:hypothetical protein [Planctomycetaceae bacterium]